MSNLLEQVMDKLNREITDVKGNYAADVMKQRVKDTLIFFCSQNDEFAETLLNSTKSFKECMEAVAKEFEEWMESRADKKDAPQGISDYEAFSRAVKFYFPAAEVDFQMRIRTKQYDKILSFKLTDYMEGGN